MPRCVLALITLALWFAIPSRVLASDGPAGATKIRRSVERTLPYLEREGLAWMEKRKCVSCHQVPAMLWSLAEASRRGFDVKKEKLREWTRWSVEKVLSVDDKGVVSGSRNLEGVAQLLFGEVITEREERFGDLIALIRSGQQADGSWTTGGQLSVQRRSQPESVEFSTSFAVLALEAAGRSAPVPSSDIDRGRQWVATERERVTNETLVFRLLLALGKNEVQSQNRLSTELVARQNDDGGWSWRQDEVSDALTTGQALFVLSRTSMENVERVREKAVGFLLGSQEDDGSWRVPSTLERKQGDPIATSDYWGTAWATIGLLQYVPVRRAEI